MRRTLYAHAPGPGPAPGSEQWTLLRRTHPPPSRGGVGRLNKMRPKPSDNTAWYDKGGVEWLPRPVRFNYHDLYLLQQWMMRETLSHHNNNNNNESEEFTKIREMHREWSQHPLMPVLGDVEPKFPLNLFKQNHRAKRRFLTRWHKANTPINWLWLPRGPTVITPLHRTNPAQFPENWRQMMRMRISATNSNNNNNTNST